MLNPLSFPNKQQINEFLVTVLVFSVQTNK